MTVDAMRRIEHFIGVPPLLRVMLMHRLIELPYLYSIASCMLSNGSGPAHFAAVTPLPTYVISGPRRRGYTAPWVFDVHPCRHGLLPLCIGLQSPQDALHG